MVFQLCHQHDLVWLLYKIKVQVGTVNHIEKTATWSSETIQERGRDNTVIMNTTATNRIGLFLTVV